MANVELIRNKCLTSSNQKLLVTSALLVVTSALLIVTMFATRNNVGASNLDVRTHGGHCYYSYYHRLVRTHDAKYTKLVGFGAVHTALHNCAPWRRRSKWLAPPGLWSSSYS